MLLPRSAMISSMTGKGIAVSGGFCIIAALMLLLVPLEFLLAAMAAAAWHELCHYAAIRLLSGQSEGIVLFSSAAHLRLPSMGQGREVLCALAGPVGGLLLLFLTPWMPRIALCAGMQSMYNLLPIYPLDGGRALKSGLLLLMPPPKATRLCGIIQRICKISILALGLYGCFWLKLGIFPLLMALLLLIRTK